jgi:hypothetical protein
MHEGFKRNNTQVNAYIDNLYRKAYGSAPVNFGQGVEVTGRPTHPAPDNTDPQPSPNGTALSQEDAVAQTEFDTVLQRTFGSEYDLVMRDMRVGASLLFSTPEGIQALDRIAPVLSELGEHAQVLGIRFLSDLGRLAKHHHGGA